MCPASPADSSPSNHIATIEECLRFAMAQQPHTIVSGVENVDQIDHNVSVIKHMKPLTSREIEVLVSRTGKGPTGPKIEPYKRKEA